MLAQLVLVEIIHLVSVHAGAGGVYSCIVGRFHSDLLQSWWLNIVSAMQRTLRRPDLVCIAKWVGRVESRVCEIADMMVRKKGVVANISCRV